MTLNEADQAASRIFQNGRCIQVRDPRGLSRDRYMIGPVRPNGTFAGFYYGTALAALVKRAARPGRYDVLTDGDGNVIGGGQRWADTADGEAGARARFAYLMAKECQL